METAQQIRIKLAQMKLTALETEYCNANWTFNLKLKSLREELEQKARKQNELQVQLAALKNCYADHQNEVKSVLAQMAKANVPGQCQNRNQGESPNVTSKITRYSPKNCGQGLFFRVGKDQKKKINLSPSITRTPTTLSSNKTRLSAEQTRKNPAKRQVVTLLKQNLALRAVNSQKTLESARSLEQLRQKEVCPDLTTKPQDRRYKGKIVGCRQSIKIQKKNVQKC